MRSEGEETGSWCQERWGSPAEREDHGTMSRTANEILEVKLTDSCLMVSLEKSMEGLARRRSASSSSLYGVTLVLEGLLLRGVMDPGRGERLVVITSPV